ncbi:ACT domain-containing protein [Candidatus Bathyarchaeota archaeon]|nr:ACT domain-containing protein [Candidatus Bathyarchaeota archaeon]
MVNDTDIGALLASTKILVHPEDYVLVSVCREEESKAGEILGNADAFSSITFDYAEVSLVLKAEEWDELKGGFKEYREEGPYRLITFDIVLDLSIVGFLAEVSARLAEAGVSIYALSTFLRDHILVKGEDAEVAENVLTRLIEDSKRLPELRPKSVGTP